MSWSKCFCVAINVIGEFVDAYCVSSIFIKVDFAWFILRLFFSFKKRVQMCGPGAVLCSPVLCLQCNNVSVAGFKGTFVP